MSAPLTWEELEAGARIEDFDVRNMPARIARVGDLWAPTIAKTSRFDLAALLDGSLRSAAGGQGCDRSHRSGTVVFASKAVSGAGSG